MEKTIEVKVIKDYEGYFESWAKDLASKLDPSKFKTIEVSAGPYRPYGIRYAIKGDTVSLDFYSGVRRGFGSIGVTQDELAEELNSDE